MLKSFAITTAFLLVSFQLFSQDFASQYKKIAGSNDTAAQAKILTAWEAALPKDPELFIAYFNYYIKKSLTEVVSMDPIPKENNTFVVTDTGTGKPVAYLNASVKYESGVLQKGFDYINRGIALHPTRLDMRFGKIYMLGQAENYPEFTNEIIKIIDFDNKINHEWLWKQGEPLDDPKDFFLGSLQDYINTIYETENDSLLPLMRQISEAVIRYYPNHVESLSNIAITYLIAEEYDKALPFLLQAERASPKDIIVLNNIAEAYKRLGDKANAKAYFEKIIRYGNKEEAKDAKQSMKSL
jgi:tetratricopeptide (TPR) repeat protein